ncbi:arylsulfatase [Cyclobacterium xiamenense]|uniref:arylsulfatase n=1 Tax=Cyclobacterium xiamenense TaxID=1297121 RepID=UPI0035CEB622
MQTNRVAPGTFARSHVLNESEETESRSVVAGLAACCAGIDRLPRWVKTHVIHLDLLLVLLAVAGCSQDHSKRRSERPNIVIVLADDLGYSDLGCYGSEIATPTLDALAKNGLQFQRFYNAARCCPTRASLLTGLYPHEAGMGGMVSSISSEPDPGPYQGFLSKESATVAELLRDAGYATYMSGKWHVGEKREHWPRMRGFDRYFGLISGGSSYFELDKDPARLRLMALDDDLWEPPKDNFYMTDAFSDHAVDFVRDHAAQSPEKPFLLYLSYTAPHWPLHALPEDIRKYRGRYAIGWDSLREERYQRQLEIGLLPTGFRLSPRESGVPAWEEVADKADWEKRMEVHAAMVDRMDQGIGRLISELKVNGMLENTLVLFLSDNGASPEDISGRNLHKPGSEIGYPGSYVAFKKPWAIAATTPFRRYKRWLEEGGIVTPLVVHWPAGLRAKGITRETGHVVDIMATCLDLANVPYPETYRGTPLRPLRGKSLRPVFEGGIMDKNREWYWEHFGHRAMRKGKWKTISKAPEFHWELFDLDADPTELREVGLQNPQVLEAMIRDYAGWAKQVGVR